MSPIWGLINDPVVLLPHKYGMSDCVAMENASTDRPVSNGSEPSDDERCRVVIADDMPDFRELLRLCLTPEFCVVGEAANGLEAVEKARAEQPDAMILDISMPIQDGLSAIPEIRASSPNTRILVLSGFTEAAVGAQAMALGAHAYLEKGSKIQHIESILSELCSLTDKEAS